MTLLTAEADTNQRPLADDRPNLGARLGRVAFRGSDELQYLQTSLGAGWRGAFMTHVRTKPGFRFEGSWSWLRLSTKLLPMAAKFPQWGSRLEKPVSARLQLGMPGASYSGAWDVATESVNLFIDPLLFEEASDEPYESLRLEQAAQRLHEDGVIEHLLQALLADINAGSPDGPSLGEGIINIILSRLYAFRPITDTQRHSRLSAFQLKRLRSYVSDHLAQQIHLADLAGQISVSPRHLSRLMQATLGITPHRYVVACRIEFARHLLTAGSLSCEAVAEASGFADYSHMSATFRRILKISPLHIRHTTA